MAAHLLQTPWTFYGQSKTKKVDYEQQIQKIAKVVSVEEFWAVYCRLPRSDYLGVSKALHFFRNDARAMWEDEENRNGGTFQITLQKEHGPAAWEKLLLGMIGEQLDPDVIGAVATCQGENQRVIVWTRTNDDQEMKRRVAAQLFETLNMPLKSRIQYRPHAMKAWTSWLLDASGPVEEIPEEAQ